MSLPIKLQSNEFVIEVSEASRSEFLRNRGAVNIIHNAVTNFLNGQVDAVAGDNFKARQAKKALVTEEAILKVIENFIKYDKEQGNGKMSLVDPIYTRPLARCIAHHYIRYIYGKGPIPSTISRKCTRYVLLVEPSAVKFEGDTVKFGEFEAKFKDGRPEDTDIATNLTVVRFKRRYKSVVIDQAGKKTVKDHEELWVARYNTEASIAKARSERKAVPVELYTNDEGNRVLRHVMLDPKAEQPADIVLPGDIQTKAKRLAELVFMTSDYQRRIALGETIDADENRRYSQLMRSQSQAKSRLHHAERHWLTANGYTVNFTRPKKTKKPHGKKNFKGKRNFKK